jgi:hypothetical protein
VGPGLPKTHTPIHKMWDAQEMLNGWRSEFVSVKESLRMTG